MILGLGQKVFNGLLINPYYTELRIAQLGCIEQVEQKYSYTKWSLRVISPHGNKQIKKIRIMRSRSIPSKTHPRYTWYTLIRLRWLETIQNIPQTVT